MEPPARAASTAAASCTHSRTTRRGSQPIAKPPFKPLQTAFPLSGEDASFDFPLIHTTTTILLNKILYDESIGTSECAVFKASLAYLFYGRAAYRHSDAEWSAQYAHSPAVLALKPAAVIQHAHVYPFDTGGYDAQYKSLLAQTPQEDFELRDIANARALLGYFWQDPCSYFWFKHDTGIRPPPKGEDDHLKLYRHLLNGSGTSTADDRRGTIEVSIDRAIPLNAKSVAGFVLPTEFAGQDRFKQFLASLNGEYCPVITYNYNGGRAFEYVALVREKLCDLLKLVRL